METRDDSEPAKPLLPSELLELLKGQDIVLPSKYLPLLVALESGKKLTKNLAEAHGFSYSSVYSILRRRGLLARYVTSRSKPPIPPEWQTLIDDMKINRLSIKQACAKYKKEYDQIYHFLKYRDLLEECGVNTHN